MSLCHVYVVRRLMRVIQLERERIEQANGWVVCEKELQVRRILCMQYDDEFVQMHAREKAEPITISRVNGDLAVARSLGDADFKLGARMNEYCWLFPDNIKREFTADLVSGEPEVFEYEIAEDWDYLIIACDGLWETLTPSEAVELARKFRSAGRTLEDTAAGLASTAIKMGSTDNITVIVVQLNV